MYLGVIADDFTGASDIANTLAKGGLATTQFFGLPQGQALQDCDAGVISLKTRSIDAGEAVDESLRALKWLKAQGCRQFIFKYCSTFDSTPRGNIGPVGEALASEFGHGGRSSPALCRLDVRLMLQRRAARCWSSSMRSAMRI
jgi:3-dehydrotetronate 4-kinase